jgi:RNA polymerase sigma factor (sigma-70 family)
MSVSLDPTTTQLLRSAGGGDPGAWKEIVRRYEPAVAAMVVTYRLQEADARDATQRTWLRLLESHQQIREPEALGGWLKTTARRECLRILAEQRRIDPLPEGTECPDTTVDVERSVLDTDQARYLRGLLTTLPARSFALINSLFQDNPPAYAQLSASTGIPVGSIGPTRARALRKLRRLVEEGSGCTV